MGDPAAIGTRDRTDPKSPDTQPWPVALQVAADLVRSAGFPAMLMHGPDWIVAAYNDGYRAFLGGRPEILGRRMLDVWDEIRDEIEPELRRAWNGETVQHDEARFKLLRHGKFEDGWFDFSYNPVRDEHGQVVGIINAAVEQTSRLKAEAALRRSESEARQYAERLELALGAGAIIGTWFWDLPNDRFTVDRPFAEAFGIDPSYGREGLSLEQVIETVHPDDRAGLIEAIEEAIARGGHYAHPYRVRRQDGNYYWIEANGEVRHADDGTPLNFPGVLLDLDERRRTELAREADEARLSAVLEALPVGVVIVDAHGKLLRQNATHRALWSTEMQADSWEGFGRWTGQRPDTGEPIATRDWSVTRALLDGETVLGELVRIMPNGSGEPRFLLNNAAPIRDPEGTIIGAVLAEQDVTALRQTQGALMDALGAKDALLYEVNHRVKNNLQVITSLLGMQAKQSRDPDVQRHLLDARARIEVIASIHQSLYTTDAHSNVEIVSFLNELAQGTLKSLGDGKVELQPAVAGAVQLPLATALPVALIVSELLTNALKYAFPHDMAGTIALLVEDTEQASLITVSDNGVGLPAGFEFAQSPGVGSRVILALSRQVRADISIHSTERGTTFVIKVPKR